MLISCIVHIRCENESQALDAMRVILCFVDAVMKFAKTCLIMSDYIRGEVEFVEELSDNLKCIACKNLLNDPWFMGCGHKVCKGCLDELWGRKILLCPSGDDDCEEIDIKTSCVDTPTRKCIESLKLRCPYKVNGCHFEPTYCEFSTHVTECSFSTTSCTHCNQQILTSSLSLHLSEECQEAPQHCSACNMKNIARRTMDEHISTLCGETIVRCRYDYAGCTVVGKRNSIIHHEENDEDEHNVILLKYIAKADDVIKGLTNNIRMATDVTDVMKREINSLRHTVTTINNSISETLARKKHQETIANRIIKCQTLMDGLSSRIKNTETVAREGIFIWRIPQLSQKLQYAKHVNDTCLISDAFYTSNHGYKMQAHLYLNGQGRAQGRSMSMFLSTMEGEHDRGLAWPCICYVTMGVIEFIGPKPDHKIKKSFHTDKYDRILNRASSETKVGIYDFLELREFHAASRYLFDDTLYVKITVEVGKGVTRMM